MRCQAYVVLVYGLLLLVGGMIGFAKAHSYPSLYMGSLSAILVITSAVFMLKGVARASYFALGLSALLAIFFTYRFIFTMKFMPAGLMAILSIITVLILLKDFCCKNK